ncbi:unnamed protein product [Blepharisma stoltei]|uniref:Sulfite exporter TauE/SafE family protein n=1 Tax=Blepharisma stoltei TaxID=1481888 RepID=A0AAU9KFL5_9CILI|nr:unnamed protein product [Blepharisma stoltei]
MAQVISFGGSLISVLLKLRLRHPTRDRPLIDYELIVFILSPILGGTTIGVILHLIFPNWLTITLLSALSGYMCWITTKKGISMFKGENSYKNLSKIENKNAVASESDRESETDVKSSDTSKELSIEHNYFLEEKQIIPWRQIAKIFFVIVIVLTGSFIKGGKGIDSIFGLKQCNLLYWCFMAFYLAIYLAISIYCGWKLIVKTERKISVNYDFDENDVKWELKSTVKIGSIAFLAGIGAGSLGIGGGIIMNPVLIAFGVRPEVSTASSSFVILFSSSISVTQYVISGLIDFTYGIPLFILAVLSSGLGTREIKKQVEKWKRPSLIVLLLGFMTFLCCVCISLNGIFTTAKQIKIGDFQYWFSSYC